MPDLFLLHALLAGIGVALMAGPLGCFIAWRQLTYFGDAVAHAALLGVVLALLLNADANAGILAVAAAITLAVFWLQREKRLHSNTILGVCAHGALALGLVLLSLSTSITLDVNGLLFGDILAVSMRDIALIWGMAALVLGMIIISWKPLMRLTLHADIAAVEGTPVHALEFRLMLAIALAVAVSIKLVGMLLITSLLIIPAASARYFSRTPTQMALVSCLTGIIAVAGGLAASLTWDTPAGPSIILAGLGIFVVARVVR